MTIDEASNVRRRLLIRSIGRKNLSDAEKRQRDQESLVRYNEARSLVRRLKTYDIELTLEYGQVVSRGQGNKDVPQEDWDELKRRKHMVRVVLAEAEAVAGRV